MRESLRIFLFLVIVWTSGLIINANSIGIWEGPFIIFSYFKYVLFLASAVVIIAIEIPQFRNTKNWKHILFTPVIIILSLIISYQLISINAKHSAKTIIEINHIPGANNVTTLKLKENNSFELIEHSILGPTIFYGTYSLQNQKIELIDGNLQDATFPYNARGTIVNDSVYWTDFDTMLIEKDLR
jgi:hypothetical protein